MDKDMHSLKEILLDAARYRWLRENYTEFYWDIGWTLPEAEEIDESVDEFIEEQSKAENE